MITLLRWLLIALLIYYIFKFLARLFFPMLLKKIVRKAEQQMKNQQQRHYQNTPENKVGETIIDKKPQTTKSNKKVGEYIDYEEID